MLREIWRMTLDNLACKLTANFDIEGGPSTSLSRSALPSPSIPVGPSPRFSEPLSPRFSSPPSPLITVAMTLTSQPRSLTKEMLQAKIERDVHRKLFRLSTDETLINRKCPYAGKYLFLTTRFYHLHKRVSGNTMDDFILPPRNPFNFTELCMLPFCLSGRGHTCLLMLFILHLNLISFAIHLGLHCCD